MIGQGQRAVADARREQLDEQGRERTIDHRREDAEDAEDAYDLELVHRGRIGRAGIARGIEPRLRRRSEEHTSELQSLMRISYAVFCLKKKKKEADRTKQLAARKQNEPHTIRYDWTYT